MNIPKKVIGWWFILTGFFAFGYLGYLQINKQPYLILFLIILSFCGCWYALFDYMRRIENG
jgi:hypothetical protein